MILNIHNILFDTINRSIELYHNNNSTVVAYGEGDYKQLVRRIQNTTEPYPMIWLSSGFNFDFGTNKRLSSIRANLEFIVLADGNKDDSFTDRYFKKFDSVIYPTVDGLMELLSKTEGISIVNDDFKSNLTDFPITDSNDIDNPKNQSTPINEIWDAVSFPITLKFSTDCFEDYIIDNNNFKILKTCS